MKDPIPQSLEAWARSKEPTREHLDGLVGRIVSEAHRDRYTESVVLGVSPWQRVAYAGAGAAAMLLAVLISPFLFTSPFQERGGPEKSSALADISPQELEKSRKLFSEVERVFPQQLRWIAESNGDLAMGVESIAHGDGAMARAMMVRFTVVSRAQDGTCWRPVWNADLLVRGEDLVEVLPQKKSGNSLALWIYPLGDGQLAVDAELALEAPVRLASRINRVIAPGETVRVAQLHTDGTEYRMYQTVEIL